MQQQLSCNQVIALLTYFIENKLNKQLAKDIEYHLSICPNCNKKFEKLKKIMNNFSEISKKINDKSEVKDDDYKNEKRYEEFRDNLSAYIDNELSDEENLKIKKTTISNPIARKDLEDIYAFKKMLHQSFEKTRNDAKDDFSKKVLIQLEHLKSTRKVDYFYIIMLIFGTIISTVTIGIIIIINN